MKKILILLLLVLSSCASKKTISDISNHRYYPIGSENATFNYADSNSFINHKDISRIKKINGKTYSTRVIEYSWGKKVETYYRFSDGTVYYYDEKSDSENVIMPKNLTVGYKWTNKDKSWEYEIIDLNAELKTPEKEYTGLLVMKASQLKNRDQTKLSEYLNYYEAGVGKVASYGNGKIMTYRTY